MESFQIATKCGKALNEHSVNCGQFARVQRDDGCTLFIGLVRESRADYVCVVGQVRRGQTRRGAARRGEAGSE